MGIIIFFYVAKVVNIFEKISLVCTNISYIAKEGKYLSTPCK